MVFAIDKGIPVEPINRQTGRKYPFPDMKPGDSFLIPCRTLDERRMHRKRVQGAARRYSVNAGLPPTCFSSRQTEEGVRCWRTA